MAQPWYNYPIFQGNAYVTTYEGPGTDTPHFAYDVQTPFHTPITAILPGIVEIADYQPWGGEIFIKPDNPNYPEYYVYHPDEVDVRAGQHVQAGQEIALSGGENPGYPGAEHPTEPVYSSGPHTHLGWFSGWYKVPETGATIPYGPDPASLLKIAQGQRLTPLDTLNLNNSQNNQSDQTGISSGSIARLGVGALGMLLMALGAWAIAGELGATEKIEAGVKKLAKAAL